MVLALLREVAMAPLEVPRILPLLKGLLMELVRFWCTARRSSKPRDITSKRLTLSVELIQCLHEAGIISSAVSRGALLLSAASNRDRFLVMQTICACVFAAYPHHMAVEADLHIPTCVEMSQVSASPENAGDRSADLTEALLNYRHVVSFVLQHNADTLGGLASRVLASI